MSLPRLPADGPSPDGFLAWRAFLRAHAAAVGKIERDLAVSEPDVPLTWYDVLVALVGAPERRLRLRDANGRETHDWEEQETAALHSGPAGRARRDRHGPGL